MTGWDTEGGGGRWDGGGWVVVGVEVVVEDDGTDCGIDWGGCDSGGALFSCGCTL